MDQKNKNKALDSALSQIEKQFGKGSLMKLGADSVDHSIEAISTGSIGLDAALGIGGKVECISITARGQNHRISGMPLNFSGDHIASDNPARMAVDKNQVEHFGSVMHLHFTGFDLSA